MSSYTIKDTLTNLGIEPSQFRALGILPLVEVAWADGEVQLAERTVIRRFAKRKGWTAEDAGDLLEAWLSRRPEDEHFKQGREALVALVEEEKGLGASFPKGTLRDVMRGCHEVATAAGGMFGLWDPVNPAEVLVLDRVALGLGIGPWRDVISAGPESVMRRKGTGPAGRFLVGSLPEYQKNSLEFMTSAWHEYGDVVYVELGPVQAYMLFHPDHAKHVLVDNNRNYARSSASDVLKELLGEGLLTSEGEHWRRQRRISQPAFHVKEVASMAETMTEVTQRTLAEWPSSQGERTPIDIAEKCQKLALRIAGITLFNVDLSDESDAFGKATKIALEYMTGRLMQFPRLPLSVPTEANRRFLDARASIDALIYKLVAERRKGQVPERRDLLQMLLDARDAETGDAMSDPQLRDELLTLLGAGHETTGLALMWTFYFLSKHPSVRQELEQEVAEVLSGRTPTLADLPKMPFTKMVLNESMRLRSPFWAAGRRAIAEDSVGGVTIPADSTVILCPHLTHRHPDFWPNPEGFDPRRFTEDKVKEMHPFAFFPFGGGPRKCIGMSFAMMELALVLPMAIQAFDLWLVPGHEPEIFPTLTLRTRDGCWMTLHKR